LTSITHHKLRLLDKVVVTMSLTDPYSSARMTGTISDKRMASPGERPSVVVELEDPKGYKTWIRLEAWGAGASEWQYRSKDKAYSVTLTRTPRWDIVGDVRAELGDGADVADWIRVVICS